MYKVIGTHKSLFWFYLFCCLVGLTLNNKVFAQADTARVYPIQTTTVKQDSSSTATPAADTAKNAATADTLHIKKQVVEQPIFKTARDSTILITLDDGTRMYLLYGDAQVIYGDLELTADYIELNMDTKVVFAKGMPDTSGQIVGKPVFREGNEEYKIETIYYNFDTKIAKINNVVTNQAAGGDMAIMQGHTAKKMPDNTIYIKNATYSTCDLEDHKHWYILMTRAKSVPDPQKVVFDFSYLVVEDVPLIPLPFGFFPKLSNRSAGFIFPSFGEEVNRGFYLQNGGYYFVFGEYADVALTADIYTLGSWGARARSRYTKRYGYEGSLDVEYSNNVSGEKGSTDYVKASTFAIRWSHRQAAQARPGQTFSASVNFSSASHQKYNTQNSPYIGGGLQNSASSSVSFSKTFANTPFNISVNATHSQNMRDSTYAITFPNFTLNMNPVYPFRSKERIGRTLLDDISFKYGMRFDNKINFKEKDFGTEEFWNSFKNGMQHDFSLTLPTLSLLNYITVSPSVQYGMNWFFQSTEKHWNQATKELEEISTGAFKDFGVTQSYGFSASMTTKLYGMRQFKQGALIQAVRHVMTPSLSFSYNPELGTRANGYRYVQSDSLGTVQIYNIYANQVYSPPGTGRSASISFSLTNNFEMKVRNESDTTGTKGRKIKLLDNLSIGGSYNLLADSLRLSTIPFGGSTQIVKGLNFNFSGTIDPYALGERGQRINKFHWKEKGGLNVGRLTNFSLSFGWSINGGKGETGLQNTDAFSTEGRTAEEINQINELKAKGVLINDLRTYAPANIPWSLSFSYNYDYARTWSYINNAVVDRKRFTQRIGINGNFTPSKNWSVNFMSGFDITAKQISTTQVSLSRDLHCFTFTFSFVPTGFYKSWDFKINIKTSGLSDVLKYDRRSSRWDQY